eukprot:CAMPEP_0180662798 /NCGR_PEP_ID=MMETSP1037_2-20121125/59579_1 /TAXON_ID=632150 /ORGANISM="Azadinium spinosum, Strain 3D9" /LENGTH=50 /DNA_ID=CAMNT_0022690475 /DNA_START=714 /DNA_END=863 /DNA_ORIENTATION=+
MHGSAVRPSTVRGSGGTGEVGLHAMEAAEATDPGHGEAEAVEPSAPSSLA